MAEENYSVRINRREGIVEITGPDKDWIAEQLGQLASVYAQPVVERVDATRDEGGASNTGESSGDTPPPKPRRARSPGGTRRAERKPELDAKLTREVKQSLEQYRKDREANFSSQSDQLAILATFALDELGIEWIDEDDLYTIYTVMGWESPANVSAALNNARSRRNYFGGWRDGKIQLSNKGENFGRLGSKSGA